MHQKSNYLILDRHGLVLITFVLYLVFRNLGKIVGLIQSKMLRVYQLVNCCYPIKLNLADLCDTMLRCSLCV